MIIVASGLNTIMVLQFCYLTHFLQECDMKLQNMSSVLHITPLVGCRWGHVTWTWHVGTGCADPPENKEIHPVLSAPLRMRKRLLPCLKACLFKTAVLLELVSLPKIKEVRLWFSPSVLFAVPISTPTPDKKRITLCALFPLSTNFPKNNMGQLVQSH